MLDNRVNLPTRETGELLGAKICWNQKKDNFHLEIRGSASCQSWSLCQDFRRKRVYVQLRELNDNFFGNKKERTELIEKAHGAELAGALTWEGVDKFKVKYSVEWQAGDYSYRTGTIEAKMKKSREKWIPYSYHYYESWGIVAP